MRFLFLLLLIFPITASAFLVRANLADGFVDVEYDELNYYPANTYISPVDLPPMQAGKQRHFFDGGYFDIDASIQLQAYNQADSGDGSVGSGLSFDEDNNALFNGIPVASNLTKDEDGRPTYAGAPSMTRNEEGDLVFNGTVVDSVAFDTEGNPIYNTNGFSPSVLTNENGNTYLNGNLISTPSVTPQERENDFVIRYDSEGNAVTDSEGRDLVNGNSEGRSLEDRGITKDEAGNISINGQNYGSALLEYDEDGQALINGQSVSDRTISYDSDGNRVLNTGDGTVSYESRITQDEDGNMYINGELMSQDEEGNAGVQAREASVHTIEGSNGEACAAIICLTDIEKVTAFECGDPASAYFDVKEYHGGVFDPIATSVSRLDMLTECKEAGDEEKIFVNMLFGMMEFMPSLGGGGL